VNESEQTPEAEEALDGLSRHRLIDDCANRSITTVRFPLNPFSSLLVHPRPFPSLSLASPLFPAFISPSRRCSAFSSRDCSSSKSRPRRRSFMDVPRSRRIEFPRKVYRDGDDPRLRISWSGLMLVAQIAASAVPFCDLHVLQQSPKNHWSIFTG